MLTEEVEAVLLSAGALLTRQGTALGFRYLLILDDGRGGEESISNLSEILDRRTMAARYALNARFKQEVDLGGES